MRKAAKGVTFRKLPLCIAMLGCLYGGTAMAQDAPVAADQDYQTKKEEGKELEKITVTGSLLRRLEYDTTPRCKC